MIVVGPGEIFIVIIRPGEIFISRVRPGENPVLGYYIKSSISLQINICHYHSLCGALSASSSKSRSFVLSNLSHTIETPVHYISPG